LAASGGKLKPFGRHSMQDRNLEETIFKLRPGELTTLIDTPQGCLLFKCDRRIPGDTTVSLEAVRGKLVKEILERKVQIEMEGAYKAIVDQAKPQPLVDRVKPPEKPGAPVPPPDQV